VLNRNYSLNRVCS